MHVKGGIRPGCDGGGGKGATKEDGVVRISYPQSSGRWLKQGRCGRWQHDEADANGDQKLEELL